MTSNATTTSTSPAKPLAPDDPRAVFARAVATAGPVIAAVRPGQLERSTPCDDYDVRRLLGHLVGVLRRVAAVGGGDDALSVPQIAEDVADDGFADAWLEAAHQVRAAWNDDAVLTTVLRLPWAEMPGAAVLAVYTNEVTVHTWDLATATGQRPAWDPRVVEVAFDAIRRAMPAEGRTAGYEAMRSSLPEELRDVPAPFAEAVEVSADSPAIERLVAWNGRRP